MAAKRRGTAGDRSLMTSTLVLSSIPYYIVALMISLYLTILYPILPRSGYTPLTDNPGNGQRGCSRPWLVLGIYNCTHYARFSRGSMVETLSEDFIRTARAKGLSDRVVTYKHALRSGLIPVITIFGLDIAGSLAGAIFTERIFDLPGLGNLVIDSLNNYDLPVIMGTVLVALGVPGDDELHRGHRLQPDRPAGEARVTTPDEGRKESQDTMVGTVPGEGEVVPEKRNPSIATRERRAASLTPSGETPYLVVQDLTVKFPTADGLVSAVTACRTPFRWAGRWRSSVSPGPASRSRAWP